MTAEPLSEQEPNMLRYWAEKYMPSGDRAETLTDCLADDRARLLATIEKLKAEKDAVALGGADPSGWQPIEALPKEVRDAALRSPPKLGEWITRCQFDFEGNTWVVRFDNPSRHLLGGWKVPKYPQEIKAEPSVAHSNTTPTDLNAAAMKALGNLASALQKIAPAETEALLLRVSMKMEDDDKALEEFLAFLRGWDGEETETGA